MFKCGKRALTYVRSLLYCTYGQGHTLREKQVSARAHVPTRALISHSPGAVCVNQTKLDHHPFIFSLAGVFLSPSSPSPPGSPFKNVHICQWFANQPAKFTTLRSNVFSFLVVLHINLASRREQRRTICKAVKITPPFTWLWKRVFHSDCRKIWKEVFIYAGEKRSKDRCSHKQLKCPPVTTLALCILGYTVRLFPVYIKNKFTPKSLTVNTLPVCV